MPLNTALSLIGAGISVIPILLDGTKSPKLGSWTEYQSRLPTDIEAVSWFKQPCGIAAIGGKISRGLECIDFDDASCYEPWREMVDEERPGLIGRLSVARTPSGGWHVRYHADKVQGNLKLAKSPSKKTKIETRGEGGYFLVEGSPAAAHESGNLYQHASGPSLPNVGTITAEERDRLLYVARLFDESQHTEKPHYYQPSGDPLANDTKPGEAYSLRGPDWADILEQHGWTCVRSTGEKRFWRRPGKNKGISATTGHCKSSSNGADLLAVFSSNATPFEAGSGGSPCGCYSKFAAYTILNHGGNYSTAARTLGEQGYGFKTRRKHQTYTTPNGPVEEPEVSPPTSSETGTAPFPIDALPLDVQEFCGAIAEAVDCPVDFPAVACLVVAGTAIGNSVSIMPKPGWFEKASLYAAVIGEPGDAKTPGVRPAKQPILRAQQLFKEKYDEKKNDYMVEMAVWTERQAQYQQGNGREPGRKPTEPVFNNMWTSDATVESMAKSLDKSRRGIGLFVDEVSGLLLGMNQYKAGGRGRDRQFYLSAWSFDEIKVDRAKDETPLIVSHPFITILGGIQPDMLNVLVDDKNREDGFTHRFLFAFPDARPWRKWREIGIPDAVCETWDEIVKRLMGKDFSYKDGRPIPHVRKLAPEAMVVRDEWWNKHITERNEETFPPCLMGPWAKFRSYFFRIALIIHELRIECHETDEWDIDGQSMENAGAICDYFKAHAKKVHSVMGESGPDRVVRRVLEWMGKRSKREITMRELVSGKFCKKASEATQMMHDMQDRGYGRIEQSIGKKGKPRSVFRLHVPSNDSVD